MSDDLAPPKTPPGRPTKLTPDVHDAIVTAIRLGATLDVAAENAGLTRETIHDWHTKGAKVLALCYTRLSNLEAGHVPPRRLVGRGQKPKPVDLTAATTSPWVLADTPKDQALARFSYDYQKALNEWELRALANITNAGKREWQASAWLLERRKPEVYGRRRVELSGPGGGPIEGRVVITMPDNGR